MANGKHRDGFAYDILHHGIPTLSPNADGLVRQVWELSSIPARQQNNIEIERRLRQIPTETWSRWLNPPWVYLQELDPVCVTAVEQYLVARLDELRTEARERGWELE